MTDEQPNPSKSGGPFSGLGRRVVSILVGLVVTLIVGAVAERVTSPEWLAQAKDSQAQWMSAVAKTSPVSVATLYGDELQSAISGDAAKGWSGFGAPEGRGLQSPFYALVFTAARLWDASGVAALVQLALGALAFAVLSFWRTKGETIFMGDFWLSLIVWPIAVVALASVIGVVLWGIMLGALSALSWVTGLAATAAGATGAVGFCWLCITELTKKGAEHVITPKV
jgi:hypothetical protein